MVLLSKPHCSTSVNYIQCHDLTSFSTYILFHDTTFTDWLIKCWSWYSLTQVSEVPSLFMVLLCLLHLGFQSITRPAPHYVQMVVFFFFFKWLANCSQTTVIDQLLHFLILIISNILKFPPTMAVKYNISNCYVNFKLVEIFVYPLPTFLTCWWHMPMISALGGG